MKPKRGHATTSRERQQSQSEQREAGGLGHDRVAIFHRRVDDNAVVALEQVK